jgi:hypothetical protein
MKLEGRKTSAVATQAALPTSLRHQSLLDLAPATNDSLDPTLTAPVIATAIKDVSYATVSGTFQNGFGLSARPSLIDTGPRRCSRGSQRLQAVLLEPMAHSGLAPFHLLGYLSDGSTGVDQRLQFGSIQTPARGVLLPIDSLKPMLIHPVGNGRFMPVKPPADLRERQSSPE